MEFELDIKTELCGKVTVIDYSRDYDLYFAEDYDVSVSYDSYKYSESVSINSILKVTPDVATLMDVVQTLHDWDVIEQCDFLLKEDGYYLIHHFVLPNKLWYETASDEYKAYYDTIYIADEGKVYKEVDGTLEECTLKEILERNAEGTTIKSCKVDVFYTGHLQECYIGYCRKVFNDLMTKCAPKTYNDDVWARDFLYMTLNIIDYLISFGQYMEAYRTLQHAYGCGNFCAGERGEHVKRGSGCGCSKA